MVASTNVSDQGACCALCHQDYHDECQGWEWIDTGTVHASHNCDVFAKLGNASKGWPGRLSGVKASPSPPSPPPGPITHGTPCHSDSDCATDLAFLSADDLQRLRQDNRFVTEPTPGHRGAFHFRLCEKTGGLAGMRFTPASTL